MKDGDGMVLYVGKAKSLRARVRSYFGAGPNDSVRTRELVRRIEDFDTIVVSSEAEALILENKRSPVWFWPNSSIGLVPSSAGSLTTRAREARDDRVS